MQTPLTVSLHSLVTLNNHCTSLKSDLQDDTCGDLEASDVVVRCGFASNPCYFSYVFFKFLLISVLLGEILLRPK